MTARSARLVGALVGAFGLVVGACGEEEEPDPIAEAEAGIVDVIAERLDATADDIAVTCPADLVVEAGARFDCDVVVHDAAPIAVDLAVSENGIVELQRAVIPTDAVEDYLEAELAVAAEGPVETDCGTEPLLVADVGDELRCDATRSADGAARIVVVTVLAADGTVRYRVETPPTTTTSLPAPP
jgi:hypothetical protein